MIDVRLLAPGEIIENTHGLQIYDLTGSPGWRFLVASRWGAMAFYHLMAPVEFISLGDIPSRRLATAITIHPPPSHHIEEQAPVNDHWALARACLLGVRPTNHPAYKRLQASACKLADYHELDFEVELPIQAEGFTGFSFRCEDSDPRREAIERAILAEITALGA